MKMQDFFLVEEDVVQETKSAFQSSTFNVQPGRMLVMKVLWYRGKLLKVVTGSGAVLWSEKDRVLRPESEGGLWYDEIVVIWSWSHPIIIGTILVIINDKLTSNCIDAG